MTKKEYKKIIEHSLEKHWLDIKELDREELLMVLNDVESYNDEICFDLISGTDGPIAIQVFTTVRYRRNNFSVILDFEMKTPRTVDELVETLRDEYEKAMRNKKHFSS